MTDETPLTEEELDEMLMEEFELKSPEETLLFLSETIPRFEAKAHIEGAYAPLYNAFKKLAQKLDQST